MAKTRTIDHYLPKIKQLYSVPDLSEIKDFLISRNHLLDVLLEIPERLLEYFPSNHGITLRLQVDPEEGYEELIVKILIDLDPDKALDCLDRFDEEWWLNQPASYHMDVCVNIGYA